MDGIKGTGSRTGPEQRKEAEKEYEFTRISAKWQEAEGHHLRWSLFSQSSKKLSSGVEEMRGSALEGS